MSESAPASTFIGVESAGAFNVFGFASELTEGFSLGLSQGMSTLATTVNPVNTSEKYSEEESLDAVNSSTVESTEMPRNSKSVEEVKVEETHDSPTSQLEKVDEPMRRNTASRRGSSFTTMVRKSVEQRLGSFEGHNIQGMANSVLQSDEGSVELARKKIKHVTLTPDSLQVSIIKYSSFRDLLAFSYTFNQPPDN